MTFDRTGESVAKCILAIAAGEWRDVAADEISRRLREAILRFGSETEDNRNCTDWIEFGSIIQREWPDSAARGIRLKGTQRPISEILNVLEELPMPAGIRQAFPGVTEQQWSAVTRLCTLLSLLLEDEEDDNSCADLDEDGE